MFYWALRDILRRPVRHLLMIFALAGLMIAAAVPLIFTGALSAGAEALLSDAPSIVIRRADPVGWRPIPIEPGIKAAESIVGVIRVRARRWGVIDGSKGPLVVIGEKGLSDNHASSLPDAFSSDLPSNSDFRSADFRDFSERFPLTPETAPLTHETVSLSWEKAGQLLNLPRGTATDLGVDVYYPQEVEAVCRELSHAFPWPVQMLTHNEILSLFRRRASMMGSAALFSLIPALIGMILMVMAVLQQQAANIRETGLLKALGWTARDVLRLSFLRMLLVIVPAILLGAAGIAAVFYGPAPFRSLGAPLGLFFGWHGALSALPFDAQVAGSAFAAAGTFILLPYIGASLWSAVRASAAEPGAFIEGGGAG